jgi:hypothetical protein
MAASHTTTAFLPLPENRGPNTPHTKVRTRDLKKQRCSILQTYACTQDTLLHAACCLQFRLTPVVCMLWQCRVLYVDPAYTGAVEAGSAAQPFKTFAKAWISLGKGMLKAGVTINIRPVRTFSACTDSIGGLLYVFIPSPAHPIKAHQQACRMQHRCWQLPAGTPGNP